jgi:hypothetical protein
MRYRGGYRGHSVTISLVLCILSLLCREISHVSAFV